MSTTELVWSIVIAVILAGSLALVFWKQRKEVKQGLAKKYARENC